MAYTFTDANFEAEVLKSELPVLVDFWAEWCGPCQMMTPIIEALATELDGRLKVGKLNVDLSPDLAQKYGVMSIPCFKIFQKGEVVEDFVGSMSKEALMAKLGKYLG